MIDFNIQNILWVLSKGFKKLGAWGILGIIILLVGFFIYSTKTSKLNEALASFKAEDSSTLLHSTQPIEDEKGVTQQFQAIDQILPTTKALPNILSKMNNVAKTEHLSLNVGDYKFNKVQDSQINQAQIAKYEVIFPVHGQYAQVRNFISRTLYELPNVSLVDLTFERENSQTATVDADLMFVVYMKEAPLK